MQYSLWWNRCGKSVVACWWWKRWNCVLVHFISLCLFSIICKNVWKVGCSVSILGHNYLW